VYLEPPLLLRSLPERLQGADHQHRKRVATVNNISTLVLPLVLSRHFQLFSFDLSIQDHQAQTIPIMTPVGITPSARLRATRIFAIAVSSLLTYPRAGCAQSAAFAPNAFKRDLSEPMKRNQSGYTGFVFDFNVAEVRPSGFQHNLSTFCTF